MTSLPPVPVNSLRLSFRLQARVAEQLHIGHLTPKVYELFRLLHGHKGSMDDATHLTLTIPADQATTLCEDVKKGDHPLLDPSYIRIGSGMPTLA